MVDYNTTDTSHSTGISEEGYSGSLLAGRLVILLFIIWFFYRIGLIDMK